MLGVKSCHRIKNITKIKDIGGVYSTVKFKTHSTQKPYSKRRCYQHLSTRCQAEKDCSLETLLDSVLGSRLHMMPVGMLGVKSSVEIVLGAGEGGTFLMSLREALQSARHKAVFEAACSRFLARSTDEKLRGEVVRMRDSVSMDSITTTTNTVEQTGITFTTTTTSSRPSFLPDDLVSPFGVTLDDVNKDDTIINIVGVIETRYVLTSRQFLVFIFLSSSRLFLFVTETAAIHRTHTIKEQQKEAEGNSAWMLAADKSIVLPTAWLTRDLAFACEHIIREHARTMASSRKLVVINFRPGHPDYCTMTSMVYTLFLHAHTRARV